MRNLKQRFEGTGLREEYPERDNFGNILGVKHHAIRPYFKSLQPQTPYKQCR